MQGNNNSPVEASKGFGLYWQWKMCFDHVWI